jgi:phosphopantothenoylcysteine decarboxylase/phosphopantothenate--cysteine ligase
MKLVLCVTGSIAAYKAIEVARLWIRRGGKVIPVVTRSGKEFVGPATLAGITGEPVHDDMWDASFPGEKHVVLAERADVVAIVPATADVIARLAQGRADDLVTAIALCARCPIVAAPAMHPNMWEHPATQRNVATLAEDRRVSLVGPVFGPVASGDVGLGRMAEPAAIVSAILAALAPKDLAGRRVLVTAGPTVEDLDPVRFLSNRSSGKMGFALAERAAARGAKVTLVTGPVHLPTPHGVRRIDVRTAVEMRGALWEATGLDLSKVDAIVMAAAIADYRPSAFSETKIKKEGESARIDLTKNPDLLLELGQARTGKRPVLVGFAMETAVDAALEAHARTKLEKKKVDFVVANEARTAFGGDENRVLVVSASGSEAIGPLSKHAIADALLDRVAALLR